MSRGRKIIRISALVFALVILICVVFGAAALIFVRFGIDYTVDDALFRKSQSGGTRILAYDSDIGDYVEREILLQNGVRKIKYGLDEISDYLKLGFIAMEDRSFYTHGGVDYKRTLGAAVNYIFGGDRIFGGSTITQQVIKNISGDSEVKITRKLAEIMRAWHLEDTYSKDEILELYLNIVPYTENAVGVGAGASTYFGKEPSELTLAEAATLVGITNSPARYNPRRHPEECVKKRNRVLYAMHEVGFIDDGAYLAATKEPLIITAGNTAPSYTSWFTETVLEDVASDIAEKYSVSSGCARLLIMGGGYDIYTTENPKIQAVVDSYFENTDGFPEAVSEGLNYSFVICDSSSGDLLAIYGGVGRKKGERLLNLADTTVTPGSVLKPLALYAPLINRKRVNWATVFDDYPVKISEEGDTLRLYPHNYPDIYDGLTPLHRALALSKNTVAVRLFNLLGAENIYRELTEGYGFDTVVRELYNENGKKITDLAPAPLALGQLSRGVSLRRLTAAYTVFPSDGTLGNNRSYTRVLTADGEVFLENTKNEKRVLRPEAARLMNKLLEEVVSSGTARSVTLDALVDTAGKTGTSGGDRDRLFVGYTPYLTAGIWCGFGDKRAIGSKSPSHLQIWDKIMQAAHEQILKNEESPEGFSTEGLIYLPYCRDSGEIFTEACEYDIRGDRLEYGYFEPDNAPRAACHRHVIVPSYELEGDYDFPFVALVLLDAGERNEKIPATDSRYVFLSSKEDTYGFGGVAARFIYRERRKKKISK